MTGICRTRSENYINCEIRQDLYCTVDCRLYYFTNMFAIINVAKDQSLFCRTSSGRKIVSARCPAGRSTVRNTKLRRVSSITSGPVSSRWRTLTTTGRSPGEGEGRLRLRIVIFLFLFYSEAMNGFQCGKLTRENW